MCAPSSKSREYIETHDMHPKVLCYFKTEISPLLGVCVLNTR